MTVTRLLSFLSASTCACAGEPSQVLELWPEGVPALVAEASEERVADGWVSGVHRPTLRLYPARSEVAQSTCILVCPGGGYSGTAEIKEGEEVAAWLNGIGIHAAILRYRTKEYGQPAPLRDVLRALRLIRAQAPAWEMSAKTLGVLGFSAGGHLAACAATLFDDPAGRTGAELDAVSARPDFAVLVYPVITMDERFSHPGSRLNLLGPNASADLVEHYSVERQVNAKTPPLFLVHTVDDEKVPVENSLLLFDAARRASVPVEMHLYESGPHGIGLRPEHPAAREWPRALAAWMERRGWHEPLRRGHRD